MSLGFGIASCFAQAGARVVLVGRRADVLKKAAKEIGKDAFIETQDVTKLDEAGGLIQRASRQAGPISILVNNAGVHLKKPAIETTPAEFQAVLQTHVMAAFSLTRAALPGMIERKHGSILFIASMTSFLRGQRRQGDHQRVGVEEDVLAVHNLIK